MCTHAPKKKWFVSRDYISPPQGPPNFELLPAASAVFTQLATENLALPSHARGGFG